jgi:hypothetical protein
MNHVVWNKDRIFSRRAHNIRETIKWRELDPIRFEVIQNTTVNVLHKVPNKISKLIRNEVKFSLITMERRLSTHLEKGCGEISLVAGT